MRKFIKLLLISLFIVVKINANIINVPSEQSSIQSAINSANNGDTILVQPGIYVENINYYGKNVVVGSLFLTSSDTTYISQTIINGNNNGSVVVFNNGENSSAIIIGFTITNGAPSGHGGGVLCYNSSPTILNCIISNNTAYNGAGIYASNSSPTILNSIVQNNIADGGGGISIDVGHLIMQNSIVKNNTSDNEGGGIHFNPGTCEITNSLILGNTTTSQTGAGLSFESNNNFKIINCTIDGNSTPGGDGAAVSVINDAHPVFTNCIFSNNSGNTAFIEKYGVYNCSITLINCNTFNNSPDGSVNISRNNCLGNPSTGGVDPLYVNIDEMNYHLSDDSPCISKGIIISDMPDTDIEGNSRPNPVGSNPDLGAYENPLGTINSLFNVDFESLIKIYPNPSKGLITLDIKDSHVGNYFIEITNINGQIAYCTWHYSTEKTIRIDLSNIAKGIYFVKVKNNNSVITEKLIIE